MRLSICYRLMDALEAAYSEPSGAGHALDLQAGRVVWTPSHLPTRSELLAAVQGVKPFGSYQLLMGGLGELAHLPQVRRPPATARL